MNADEMVDEKTNRDMYFPPKPRRKSKRTKEL
jgi:hypothetical protein